MRYIVISSLIDLNRHLNVTKQIRDTSKDAERKDYKRKIETKINSRN